MLVLDQSGPRRSGPGALLPWTLGATALIFLLLELWRPCYFLTDDNFSSGFPAITEMGRRLKEGRSPFYTDYLFGGHYFALRDLSYENWHPLLMALSLLADTVARFWIIDLLALALFLITVTGFTLVAGRLRDEFSLAIPDSYLIFYTLSFAFSTFILTVGPSWIGFLATQSCLPWLVLGMLESRPFRGTLIVALFTLHELLLGYLGLLVSVSLCLTALALCLALTRRSIRPLLCWVCGNLTAVLVLTPLFFQVMDGFGHSSRGAGMPIEALTVFSVPPATVISSFFLGNWTELFTRWGGDTVLASLAFPLLPTLLACPAAWCVWPALFSRDRWGSLDKFCLALALILVLFMIRPHVLAVIMHQLPILRSLRWPFREGLLFLFFIHLFLILRYREKAPRWQTAATVFSVLMFALPLPFDRPPSLNTLALDRQLVFSGKADAFWSRVKTRLQPGDQIATIVDVGFWEMHGAEIPLSLIGTANFPCLFQLPCISGYSSTAPRDQQALKTEAYFWFGAFRQQQVDDILAQKPDLVLLRIVSTHPLKITLSRGAGPSIDLTPDLQAAGIAEAKPASAPTP